MKKELIKEAFRLQQLAGLTPINTINEDMEDDNEEMYDDEDTDTWNKPDEFDSMDDEKEPTTKDIKANTGVMPSNDLTSLISKKDELLKKLKSGEISIMQYKSEIGDIPQRIKALQAAMDKDLSIDDEDEL